MTFQEFLRKYTKLAGAQIAAVTRPVAFVPTTGVLYIRVSTAPWCNELAQPALTAELLALLPEIDGDAVRRIVWQREAAPAQRRPRMFAR